MENIKEFLSTIGFGKNESEIYMALVESGESSVLKLAKRTKIHRSNIYDALRNLLQHGLIYELNDASNTKLFSARHPRTLLDYLKHREAELTGLIKTYESNVNNSKHSESKIRMSKGVFALREAFHSLLNEGDIIRSYGIPLKAVDVLGPVLPDFHKERIKRKVVMQHIYNSEGAARAHHLNKLKYTEARVLPKKYDSLATTHIAGNKVIIFLWDKEMTVVEIEDENMARPYHNYFEILWNKAKVV